MLFSVNIDWLSSPELTRSLPVICLQVVYNERISQDKGVLLSRFSAGNTPDVSFDNSPTEEHVRGSLDSVADKFGERRPRRAFV